MFSIAQMLERLIANARLVIIIAVIAGLISAFLMVLVGAISIAFDFTHFFNLFKHNAHLETVQKTLIINAVSAMDTFLIGTVLLIFSVGLYELFIQKIEGSGPLNSKALVVKDLDQLKEKLAKVILMVLFVTFFKYAISISYSTILDLIYLALSILLIAIAMFLGRIKLKV